MTPFDDKYGHSEDTPLKQRHFAAIMERVAGIFKTTSAGRGDFVYFDLMAGPGHGSPTIAAGTLKRMGVPSRGWCFEPNQRRHAELVEALRPYPGWEAVNMTCEAAISIAARLSRLSRGLCYADPNSHIPTPELSRIGACLPSVDILFHAPGTTIKRVTRSPFTRYSETLRDAMDVIGKKHWQIRQPYGNHQWTFLLGTNGALKPDKKISMYDIRSQQGHAFLERVNLTPEEMVNVYGQRRLELV